MTPTAKLCTNCHQPRTATNVRTHVEPWVYQLYAECSCGGTYAVTLWEAPEESDQESAAA